MDASDRIASALGVDYWVARPLQDVYDHMSAALHHAGSAASFETCNSCIDILLTCLCVNGQVLTAGEEASHQALQCDIARLVKDSCMRYQNICSTLFHHFLSLPDPVPFIEILPAVMIVCPNYKISDAFDTLIALSENSPHTISVLAVLLDVDLSLVRKQRVIQLVEDALCSTAEADFPPLFKLIFANLHLFAGSPVIRKLRQEIVGLPVDSVVVLLFESMVDTMPYFATVARMLMSDITSESAGDFTGLDPSPVSLFDVVVVLISLAMPACTMQAQQVVRSWMGVRFPRDHIMSIMERRTSHEVWQRFVPSLRKLLSWMFETAVVESICSVCHGDRPGNKKSSRIGVGEAAQTALLREMFAGFYKHCSEQRESVLSFMLNECFVLCGATSLATFTTKQSINYKSWIKKHEEKNRVHRLKKRVKLSRGAGFMGCSVLAPIGSSVVSWGPRGAVGNEHFAAAADIEALGTKITLALVILEDILVDEGTGGPAHSVVLRYLLERFRPSAHEAGGRHRLKLPSPYVLYRVLSCYMKLPVNVEHTVSWDNTTMITVQKLINYISSYVDHSLLQVFHLVHCGEEDTAPLNGNALDGNVLKSSVHRGLSFQSAFIQNLYEEDIVAADLSNISAQGVGILFAATMRCVYPANDLLRPQPSLVQCSSSSHDSIHSPSQREPVTSNETYGRFFGDMTSATRSIALAAQNFTDSSIFFIMDYFVGCLRRLGESCAGPNCVGIASPLLSTCETAFAYFLKSCRFLRSSSIEAGPTWYIGALAAECVDTIIRTSASSTSWSTVNELTALILWIVNCLSSFSILLRNANKSLEQFVRIKHSTQFLFGNSDRISSTTSTQTRKSKNYNAYGLSIDYPSRLETVYIDWPDLSGDYCASDSICETSDELTTKLKLAWEHALTACALSSLLTCRQNENDMCLQNILLVLCNIAWSREYLREAGPFTMEATTKEYRSSVKLPLSNKVGSKRQKVTESDENLQLSYCRNKTILRKNAGMECHNKQIQRCMDRLSTSIPIEILSESINKLMVPAERILLLKMSIQEMVVNSSVRNDTSLIFTAGGISLLFAFCAARLPSVPSIGGMLPQTKIQFIDLFVSIDEFMADSKQRESVILFQDDPNIAMAGRLVGLYPFLTQMSEALLLFGDNLPSENSAQSELQISTMLGDVAEYSSRSVALCAVSLLGRFVITELWQSCNANLGAISFCEAFGSITGISDRANTSPEANVLQFLAEVEISSLQSRDALIGLSGMLFLLDVCGPCTKVTSDNPLKQHVELFNGSTMHMKMVSLAWRLCSGLQSAFTMVLPSKHAHMNGFIPVGKGILFGHLLAELSDTRLLVEALRRLDNADGDCVVCYSDAISIGQDFKQSKLSIEEFYFVKFWGYYFSFESPFNRTLGTQIAISSVFTTLLTASVPPAAVLEKQTIPLALFSRVDDENMLDYFRILTAFVPALYLGAQPKTSPGDDPNVTVSPYIHFLLVTSLVLDTVDTYAQLFDVITSKTKSEKAFTKKKTDFALNGLDVFCKTCKNTVIAMSVSVNRAVDWRNRQAMASLALDQTSNPSYQKEPDIGDLSLLVVVLKWAVVCTETIAKLASTVKQSALTACGGRKQISIRSLPLLTQACDKVMKHLHSILRRHGINHLDGVDEAERCYYANVLRTLSQRYLAKLVSFAGQRFDENSWNDIAAPKKDMFIEVNESIVAAASSQILSSERSTRWGIYQAEVWSCTPRDLPLSTTKAAKPSHTILSAKLPEVRQRCAVSSDEDSFDSTFLSSTDASSSDSKSESYLDDSSDFSDDSNATHSDDDWGEGNLVASKI